MGKRRLRANSFCVVSLESISSWKRHKMLPSIISGYRNVQMQVTYFDSQIDNGLQDYG
jgi:hypothetical protein